MYGPEMDKSSLTTASDRDSDISVTFLRSAKTAKWVDGTLLDLAEANQVEIGAGCRYGDCATCQTVLIAGEVTYLHDTGVSPDPGTCLLCSCIPATSVVLDL